MGSKKKSPTRAACAGCLGQSAACRVVPASRTHAPSSPSRAWCLPGAGGSRRRGGARGVAAGRAGAIGSGILFLIVTPDVWITANFKESRSAACAWGTRWPRRERHGNSVKIVQRIPVKIVIDRGSDPYRPFAYRAVGVAGGDRVSRFAGILRRRPAAADSRPSTPRARASMRQPFARRAAIRIRAWTAAHARQQLTQALLAQSTDLVKLYKALGGGWEAEPAPAT